jgi:hypothetical protein
MPKDEPCLWWLAIERISGPCLDAMMRRSIVAAVVVAIFVPSTVRSAEEAPRSGGRLNNLKVLSDKVDDVTTVENILKSFVMPGMSQDERAKSLWKAAVRYRHQTAPPNEYLAADWEAHDPVKLFNVYGYCMCCCASALIESLNRLDGREARGRILNGHSVPEVRYDGGWHMFDASLITFFPKPGSGSVASVDEISKAVDTWYASHPGYRKDGSKLLELMRSDGWTRWKSQGPELLAACPFYRAGYLPARTHGWDATMIEYDRKAEIYEYGYHVGHRALFSLGPGESIVREAGNHGLHINRETMADWDALKAKAPLNDLEYVKEFVPGYQGGVVGNGVQRYEPDLRGGGLALGAETYENLASGGSPALHVKSGDRPGVAVIAMSSPYVYLSGSVVLKGTLTGPAARVVVSLSTDCGRTYRQISKSEGSGGFGSVIDISKLIERRYAYWLKLEITSGTPKGAGLDRLQITNDFQHAPRTLPWLAKGPNTIIVAADGDTGIASRTFAGKIVGGENREPPKNETIRDLGVVIDNLNLEYDALWWKGGTGTLTLPIDVPGDLAALRWSAQVRARSDKDLVRMRVSGDGGKTWRDAGRIGGPTQGTTGAFHIGEWPAGTRSALLRFELTGNNTVGILSFRADADYRDPRGSTAFRPFRVVHRWSENGKAKSHAEVVKKLPSSYTITTSGDPVMIAVSYEMPATP